MKCGIKLAALTAALLLTAPLQAQEVDHSGHRQATGAAVSPVALYPSLDVVAPTDHSGHAASPAASAPTAHSGPPPVAGPDSSDEAAPPPTGARSTPGGQDHAMPQMQAPAAPPMLEASGQPIHDHSGHQMPAPAAPPGTHDHGARPTPAPSGPGPGPGPALPVPTAEEVRAAFPELGPHAHMQVPLLTQLLVERLEVQDADGEAALLWEASAMVGNDMDWLVFSSEGERLQGETEEARHELYWRHAVSRWWESRLGVRHDDGEGEGRDWLGLGVEGLAPFFVELSAVAYVGQNGRSAATLEAEYDLRLTNRLILQPRLELNAYGRGDAGQGLAETEAGLRLRYEVRREFAPYLGVEWRRLHGDTADLARAGERSGEARGVAGFRFWY